MNRALLQPWCSIGSAYATEGPLWCGHPHPRNFGTFPRVLGVYVRERGLLRLEDAVRKMTSLNAAKLGLRDRGLLRPGHFADVMLFDPERSIDRVTHTEAFHYGEGIEYVIRQRASRCRSSRESAVPRRHGARRRSARISNSKASGRHPSRVCQHQGVRGPRGYQYPQLLPRGERCIAEACPPEKNTAWARTPSPR